MERELLYNSIQTPDGTVLVSRHGHDFSEHTQMIHMRRFVNVSHGVIAMIKR